LPRSEADAEDTDDGLPPAGRRWGAGAQSVLPYLTKTLQARPAHAVEVQDAPTRKNEQADQGRPASNG
jgi:hypothetical protein